jgi:hypothetical protein
LSCSNKNTTHCTAPLTSRSCSQGSALGTASSCCQLACLAVGRLLMHPHTAAGSWRHPGPASNLQHTRQASECMVSTNLHTDGHKGCTVAVAALKTHLAHC